MKILILVSGLCLLATGLGGCGVQATVKPEETTPIAVETPALISPNPGEPAMLFADTDQTREIPVEPQIVRSRFVKIRLDLLLDETGQARDVKEIVFNLFPDVSYTGVVEEVVQNGDGYSWSGYLKDVDTSYFTMVYTSGVFMGHFASPLGVYETAFVDGDLYRVIMIDQTKFPGGEG